MKTYKINSFQVVIEPNVSIMVTNPDDPFFETFDASAESLPDSAKNHVYSAPYERNDRYITLRDEADASTRDSELEPLSGHLLYADLDFEYNYYAESYERDLPNKLSDIAIGSNYMPDLNLWLLHHMQDADGDGELNYIIPQSQTQGYRAIFSTFVESPTNQTFELGGVVNTNLDPTLSKEYFNNYKNWVFI